MNDAEKKPTPIPAIPARPHPDIPPLRREPRDGDNRSPSRPQASRMSVGPGIRLKGEISNCAALVVEGDVDATLDGEGLEIAQRGVFCGTAHVETAEIQGRFEGDLVVSGLLRVESGGSISGTVRYGRIEVAAGGELSGEIRKCTNEDIKQAGKEAAGAAAQAG